MTTPTRPTTLTVLAAAILASTTIGYALAIDPLSTITGVALGLLLLLPIAVRLRRRPPIRP